MIVDVCTYNGEAALFDIRYNVLKDFVDEFVVVEARTTFSGKPKELYFPLIQDKYQKVKYHIIDENYSREEIALAESSPNVPKDQHWWKREFLQKESIKKAVAHLHPDDIVFVSDVDEIWNPEILPRVANFEPTEVYKLKQLVYAYYLNNRSDEPWANAFVTTYQMFQYGCLNHFRTGFPKIQLPNAGWHFTNMGNLSEVIRKLESYGHQEYNTEEIKNNLGKRIINNEDFIGRPFKLWIDEIDLPKYLLDNKAKYIHLFK